MKVYTIIIDGRGYTVPQVSAVVAEIEATLPDLNPGEQVQIEVGEMSKGTYDALPEFEGFQHD